jgi:hypothetical protein
MVVQYSSLVWGSLGIFCAIKIEKEKAVDLDTKNDSRTLEIGTGSTQQLRRNIVLNVRCGAQVLFAPFI